MYTRLSGSLDNLYVIAEDAAFETDMDIKNFAVAQHNAVLDLAFAHNGLVADGGKGPDVRVFYQAILADDGRTAYNAVNNLRTFSDHYFPCDHGLRIHFTLMVWRDIIQDETVGFEQVGWFTCVLPPTGDFCVADLVSFVDEVLVSIRNLQFTACAWFDCIDCFEDGLVVEVYPRNGKIALRLLRLLFYCNNFPIPNLRHTETFRVFHF